MSRLSLITAAVLAAVAAGGVSARADDPPGKTPEPTPAPATKPAQDAKPAQDPKAAPETKAAPSIAGQRVRVKLRNGGVIEGVALASGTWERRDAKDGWLGVKRGSKGAGIRLWWVQDLDGFQFVVESEIVEMQLLGPVTSEETRELQKRAEESKAAAERERLRRQTERAAAEDVADKARSLLDEVEKAKAEAAAAKAKDAGKPSETSLAKRWAELLAKFPPDVWTPATPAEIERRKIVLVLFPNEQEKAFLAVLDEWKPAYEAWKAAQGATQGAAPGAAGGDAKTPAAGATRGASGGTGKGMK
jgi:hypothetical protein